MHDPFPETGSRWRCSEVTSAEPGTENPIRFPIILFDKRTQARDIMVVEVVVLRVFDV